MGVNFKIMDFSNLSSENSIRFDYRYLDALSENSCDCYTYDKLFEIEKQAVPDISDLDTFLYAEISNVQKTGEVIPVSLSFEERNEENESLFRKIEKGDIFIPERGNILISKTRPYLNKNVLVRDDEIYFTKAFLQIKPKINSIVLYYSLRTIFFNILNSISRQGKGYPTLNEDDLKNMKFPKKMVDRLLEVEKKLADKIKDIYDEIYVLRSQRTADLEIINKVLGEELNFNWKEFDELKSIKSTFRTFVDFSSNIDCRFSFKFHNPAGIYLYNFLTSKTNKKVKDFISEPILLGKGISPSDYDDEEGEYYYITMSSIKNWYVDLENSRKVNDEFSSKNINKSVRMNDILLARSGEGTIGKVALIEDEEVLGIFADFIQRVRLENYNVLLAYYYFRSDFFQYLVYTHKKGLGNNTNIFPVQIQDFPMIDWEMGKQLELADKIKGLIDEQRKIDYKIESKKDEIARLIKKTVNN